MSGAGLDTSIRRLILDRLREWHGVDPEQVGGDRPLAELGATSRDAVALAAELSELTGVSMPATLLWEAATLDQLARRVSEAAAKAAEPAAAASSAAAGLSPRPQSSGADPLAGKGFAGDVDVAAPAALGAPGAFAAGPRGLDPAVAVVGIGCRLPGEIASPADLWQLLSDGVDAIGTLPEGRWTGFAAPDDPGVAEVSRHGGFVGDVAGFDAEFFGIAPIEAVSMDPQQRLLLEVTRESLDHAGIAAAALAGTRTGVFVGISGNEYAHLTTSDLGRVEAWTPPGAALSIAANRLSYVFDLRGPSMALDSACSSSLVAVHHAVRSLAGGECDTALAGGVNVLLSPALTLAFQRAGALAPDGRCKTFDAAADGMVRAEGCGVVVLRRLADAERDGNRVLAVIRASAVNSDGRSNGLLAPNAEAQRALLAEVYAASGVVAPAEVDYVEAHGTGTALGDPVEAGALGAVLGQGRAPDQPLLIGSVKTNLGHLEAAAGITGLIKTVLALHHGELPPHLHYDKPSPHIDFDALALRVVTETEPWPRYSGIATAGVSAFGFGGTNAHVVLQEYRPSGPGRQALWAAGADVSASFAAQARSRLIQPQAVPAEPLLTPVARGPAGGHAPAPALLVLDAPTPERLREDAGDLAAWLLSPAGARAPLADVAHTLLGRLGRGRHRAAVVTRTGEQAGEALTRFAAGQPHPGTAAGQSRAEVAGAVWVFSGYGSQWPGMGRALLDQEPAFAAAIDRLEPLIQRYAGLSLRAHLEPDAELTRARVVQPVLFGLQVALADLWRAHGFRPAAVIGHSMGEVAAAVVAGALTEDAGARIISARSRLLGDLAGGAMAVVDRSPKQVESLAEQLTSLQIAVYSSPGQCVVAGAADEVERLIAIVTGDGGLARPLPVAAAGHTPQVDVLLEPLAQALGVIEDRAPDCRFYTTVYEDPRDTVALDCAYWVRNLRNPVRFQQAVSAAAQDGHRIFVEVSAHPTQLYPITETLRTACVEEALLLPTLRRDTDDAVTFRLSLAALVLRGLVDPAAARASCHPGARVVDMPSARWRHQRYWATTSPVAVSTARPAAVMEGMEIASAAAVAAGAAGAAGSDRRLSTEERLRACVAQVMGYPPESIGADTPLTELGLDSLQAVRILGVVKHEFGVELTPKVLLRQGTVAQVAVLLASEVVQGTDATHDTETVAVQRKPSTAENCECPDDGCAVVPEPASAAAGTSPKRGVLPRDATERMVARVWEVVSGRELSGVDDELIPLARCPQLAASLAHALGEQLGQQLNPADLPTDLPTVAAIAARLRPLLETPVQGPVRVLRAQGSQTPLFLIHPAGGSTAVYRALVQRLGPERPVYGLERPAESSGIVEVADQAAEYVRLIRELRPQGPWALGGWSYGGLVGQATARLLAAHGTVSALILIDSVLPLPAPARTPEQEVRQRFEGFADYVREAYDCDLDLPYGELAALDDAAQVDLVIKALKIHADLPQAVLKHQRDSYLDLRAGERHKPEPYPGRTLLYRAGEEAPHTVSDPRYQRRDETLGWEEYCSDLDVRPVPGHHLSLLDPPVVDVLGRRLAKDLALSDVAGPERSRPETAGFKLIRPEPAKPGALRPVFIRPDIPRYDPSAAGRPVTARSEP